MFKAPTIQFNHAHAITVICKRTMLTMITCCCFMLNGKSQCNVKSGSYTGDGNDDRAITGIGFQPVVVIIKGEDEFEGCIRTSSMSGDNTKKFTGGVLMSDAIQSLDADGFTIGTNEIVNVGINSPKYYWLALNEDAGKLEVGSYTGDGTDDRNLTPLTFQPSVVIIIGENSEKPVISMSSMPADNTMDFLNSSTTSNRIQQFLANGFQVGSNNDVNESGIVYHYIAIRDQGGKYNTNSYLGNGTDDRSITGLGMQPDYVFVKAPGYDGVQRMSSVTGDSSLYFDDTGIAANMIQALEADGFQVGTVNQINFGAQTYYWFALSDQGPLPIELVNFTANSIEKSVLLEWSTATEINNDYFTLERSKDGLEFEKIKQIPGAGNSSQLLHYSWVDEGAYPGVSYYRLKQTDYDGKFEYFEVQSVEVKRSIENEVLLYPNPSNGYYLKVSYEGGKDVRIILVNSLGETVYSRMMTEHGICIFKEKLSPGIYYVIGQGEQQLFNKKMIVH